MAFRLQRRTPPPLPWARPRRELLLLALVGIATLTPLYPLNVQDVSRVCLAKGLVHLHLHNDPCLNTSFAGDRAVYGGHYYSDKAPGMSALEVPGVVLTGLPNVTEWRVYSRSLWVTRVLAGGIAFLVGVFVLGRISEGLAPGYGGAAIVAYGLGMLVAPLAAANFEHVTAGTLGLAAFALAWRRRAVVAGLLAGLALLVAYEAALMIAILAGYVLLQGRGALFRYLLGVLPGAAVLLAYNWLAFGDPWHLSYRYIDNEFAANQAAGFFGVHLPRPHSAGSVLVGGRGLLLISPVVLAAAYGLVLLARRLRAEALMCALVAAAFLLLDVGYFDPTGGVSPGPRFLVPGLPFLAIGLGPAFSRRFRLTAVLTVLSVVAMAAVTLTWANVTPDHTAIWGELAGLPVHLGSSRFAHALVETILVQGRSGRWYGASIVAACALAAVSVSLLDARRSRGPVGDGARAS